MPSGAAWWVAVGGACLSGCVGSQSVLAPAGPSAQAIALVWWWMLGVAVPVLVGVVAAWLLAMRRGQERAREMTDATVTRHSQRWIVGGGIVLPVVAITALLALGSPAGLHQLPLAWSHEGGAAPLRIEVVARQWAWSLQYPESGVRLDNELRLPVGRPVDIHLRSQDVIHSFWVPRLGGKIDAIPGRTNVVRLQADRAGVFRGQCAEFCGLHHAHMVMTVIAMPAADFDAWQAGHPAPQPRGAGNE